MLYLKKCEIEAILPFKHIHKYIKEVVPQCGTAMKTILENEKVCQKHINQSLFQKELATHQSFKTYGFWL